MCVRYKNATNRICCQLARSWRLEIQPKLDILSRNIVYPISLSMCDRRSMLAEWRDMSTLQAVLQACMPSCLHEGMTAH
jgi:hypothetical protein